MRRSLLPLFFLVLSGCELPTGKPHLRRYQFEGVVELCGLDGARFSEGSFFFGTPSVIDIRGLQDQPWKRECILRRPEFKSQSFRVEVGN